MSADTLILVAVRLKSSRLPKKAVLDLSGEPLIYRLHERINRSQLADRIVWCTSDNQQDDPLEKLAKQRGIDIYRGSEKDVMSRFIEVAEMFNATTVVRVTGDNPLTDPEMMDYMIDLHRKNGAEYSYTEDLPVGTRPEIIDVSMLNRIYSKLNDPESSEYMTYMLNRPDKVNTLCVSSDNPIVRRSELRLTVDTAKDLELMRKIYNHFDGVPPKLSDVIIWLDSNPKILEINSDIQEYNIPDSIDCDFIDD